MPTVGDRRFKSEVLVKRGGGIILGMNGKRSNSDDIGNLKRALQGVQEQPRSNATALPVVVHGEARQNEQRNRMTRHAFGNPLRRIAVTDLTGHNRIESNDLLTAQSDVGLRRIHLLRLQGMANEKTVQLDLTTGKAFHGMSPV